MKKFNISIVIIMALAVSVAHTTVNQIVDVEFNENGDLNRENIEKVMSVAPLPKEGTDVDLIRLKDKRYLLTSKFSKPLPEGAWASADPKLSYSNAAGTMISNAYSSRYHIRVKNFSVYSPENFSMHPVHGKVFMPLGNFYLMEYDQESFARRHQPSVSDYLD